MSGLGLFPIGEVGDDAPAHQAGPDTVGDDLRKALVLWGGDEGCEDIARIVVVLGECRRGFVTELGEGPHRFDGGSGLEGDLDERLAVEFVEAVHGHATGGGHLDGLGAQHGRELEEVFLRRFVGRRIVAAGALHLDAEESRADDDALGGHGDVVLARNTEACRATKSLAAFHAQELSDEEVHGLVVEQGLVDPPAEGAAVVEGGVEDVGILGEDVLPVAHPMVGPARIVQ